MIAAAGNFGLSWILEVAGLIVVAGLIWRYIAPLLNKLMVSKVESIRTQLSAGEEARAEGARVVAERQAELAAAKVEAQAIEAQAKHSAELLLVDGKRRAEEEYQRYLSRIEQEIEAARVRARHSVMEELGAVVVVATEAVVRAEMTDPIRHRLIGEAISATESETMGANA